MEIDQLTNRLDDLTQKQTEHLGHLVKSSVKSKKIEFNDSIISTTKNEKSQNNSMLNSKEKLNLSNSETEQTTKNHDDKTVESSNNKEKQTKSFREDDDSSSGSYDDDFDSNTNQK